MKLWKAFCSFGDGIVISASKGNGELSSHTLQILVTLSASLAKLPFSWLKVPFGSHHHLPLSWLQSATPISCDRFFALSSIQLVIFTHFYHDGGGSMTISYYGVS
jgi:hypothetical protein